MAKKPHAQYLHLNPDKEAIVDIIHERIVNKYPDYNCTREKVYSVISQYEKLLLTHVTRNHAAEYRWKLKGTGMIFVSQKGSPKIKQEKREIILRNEKLNLTLDEIFFAV